MKTRSTTPSTETTTTASAPAAALPPPDAFAPYFEQVRAECAALDPASLAQLSLDITAAVVTAIGALPGIRAQRAAMSRLPDLDLARIDRLETYARATHYAQGAYLASIQPVEDLPALFTRGDALRSALVVGVEALARKNLMPPVPDKALHGGTGYRELSEDLVTLAAHYAPFWSKVSTRTAIDAKDLVDAESIASRVLVGLGQREHTPDKPSPAASDRHRAVTLLIRTYDQVRRALTYLRWDDDDVDRIAPPLYKRGVRARGKEQEPSAPAQPVAPAQPAQPAVPVVAPANIPQDDPFLPTK